MNDNELDDLFRSNADYLGDEPPRDFDQAAFWQQLQAEMPKKTESRKKPAAWWWAAASMLLAGMLGGIWWMRSAETEVEKIASVDSTKVRTSPWSVSPQTDSNVAEGLWGGTPMRHRPRTSDPYVVGVQENEGLVSENANAPKAILTKKGKHHTALSALTTPPELEPVTAIKTLAALRPVVENTLPLPQVVAPALPEKPAYRVVHINEIRERKQQEAKARSRVVFRIGVSEPPPNPEAVEDQFKLSIPIPH